MQGPPVVLKIYEYKGCGTCRKAVKWLEARGEEFQRVAIREQPPTEAELRRMLKVYGGNIRRLFNTSGGDYKALNLKDKLPGMSEADAIGLLMGNGNLVKRPFVLVPGGGVVGFREEEWETLLG
ncbi:MAG: ArsC family transcriptional regulator [Verrucomicrobiales bacterium]|nr:ArsC family transcriptional regulator [Verrucomicrobiales bacterium]|tara:strand:+ start:330 stop:701 length:372 start_codon:yes stop_codon:yes gene_type:complete